MPKSLDKTARQEANEIESFRSLEIRFIGEQDGNAERELKARLAARFQADVYVREAYLVRVRHGTQGPKVALCVTAGDEVRSEIVEASAAVFRTMFKEGESMDILFLSPAQLESIRTVASPFYQQQMYRA